MKTHDLTIGLNPFGPSKKVRNALRKAIKKINAGDQRERIFLRKQLAIKEGIKETQVSFFSSLPLFLNFFFDVYSIRSIGLIEPISKRVESVFESLRKIRKETVVIQSLRFEKDFDKKCPQLDLIFVVYPHDVMGLNVGWGVEDIISFAESRNLRLIVDETLREFADLHSTVPYVVDRNGFLVIRSFSEFYGLKGLRLYSVVGNEKILEELEPCFLLEEISYLAYAAIRTALKDKKFKERTRELIEEEKSYIVQKAKKIEGLIVEDPGLNLLLLKSPYFTRGIGEAIKRTGLTVEVYKDEGGPYICFPVKKRKINALFIKTLAKIIDDLKRSCPS